MHFQKIKINSSSDEFILLPQQNLDFKHSLDVKMSLKGDRDKRFKDYSVQKVPSIDNPGMSFLSKRKGINRV